MKERLVPIPGTPINILNLPKGCPFCARCEQCMKICLEQMPEEIWINENHKASCWMNIKDKDMLSSAGNNVGAGALGCEGGEV